MKYTYIIACFLLTVLYGAQAQLIVCDTTGARTNLGLYGGPATDLAFTPSGRLFAGVNLAKTLFTSDDTGNTWYASFPYDSIEFECGERGWGGGSSRVLTNQTNWVAAYTQDVTAGTISSSVISFQNGDTGTWHTAIDGFMLEQMGFDNNAVTGIGLSDYYLYVLLDNYIARIDTSVTNSSDVLDINTKILGLDSANYLKSIAVANSVSGYPIYVVIDSVGATSPIGKLYKYDGTNFTNIALPSGMAGVVSVYTHPGQITADTIFISAKNSSEIFKLYRSFNGGSTWTSITPNPGVSQEIFDADFSPNWKSSMASSNGLLLVVDLGKVSKDLGSTWISSATIPQSTGNIKLEPLAMHPNDTTIFSGSSTPGIYKSVTGIKGPAVQLDATGLEAVLIWKVDKTENKSIYYVATQSGLAYTEKYSDTSIAAIDKWQSPYGIFPISITDIVGGVTAVAIDPYDSSHVISGTSVGFFVTHTGPNGFTSVFPSSYDVATIVTKDIDFVTSDVIIAVTGTSKPQFAGNGDIWRSTDGGDSWTNVSPLGFGTGAAIAVGFGVSDTVVYVGSGLQGAEVGYLWKSADLGQTWSIINTGPEDYNTPSVIDLPIRDISVDPRGKDTLYITAGYNLNLNPITSYRAFVKSIDGGLTYNYINVGSDFFYNSVEVDPAKPDTAVYVENFGDLYRYYPYADTSILIYTGLPSEIIYDISIGSILVGTTTGFYTVIFGDDDLAVYTGVNMVGQTDETFVLYPTPADNNLIIEFKQELNSDNIHLEIYDISGRQLYSKIERGSKRMYIPVSDLANGMYYIKIAVDNKTWNKKIMVLKK